MGETEDVKMNSRFQNVNIENDVFAINQIKKLLPRFTDVLK